MQQHVVDLARAFHRQRSLIARAPAYLGSPTVSAGRVAHYRQRQRLGGGAFGLLVQEEGNRIQAGAAHGADLGHRRAQLARQLERVDLAAPGLHQVAHVQQHESRQSHRQHRRGQHQLPLEVQGIQNQQHRIGLGRARHFAAQHVHRDARVFGIGGKRVNAGQVNQRQVRAAHAGHQAHALLHCDPRVVGNLLPQTGQAIEKSGFTGVGRSNQYHRLERRGGRRSAVRLEGRGLAASTHRAASVSSWISGLAARPEPSGFSAPCASGARIRMASAVSWRRAISMPSTP